MGSPVLYVVKFSGQVKNTRKKLGAPAIWPIPKESHAARLFPVLRLRFPTYVITIHQPHSQTGRQTDGRHAMLRSQDERFALYSASRGKNARKCPVCMVDGSVETPSFRRMYTEVHQMKFRTIEIRLR